MFPEKLNKFSGTIFVEVEPISAAIVTAELQKGLSVKAGKLSWITNQDILRQASDTHRRFVEIAQRFHKNHPATRTPSSAEIRNCIKEASLWKCRSFAIYKKFNMLVLLHRALKRMNQNAFGIFTPAWRTCSHPWTWGLGCTCNSRP